MKSKYADKSRVQNWRIDRSALSGAPLLDGHRMGAHQRIAGFQEAHGSKALAWWSKRRGVAIVLSDGLAAVSIFIEAMPAVQATQSLSHQAP